VGGIRKNGTCGLQFLWLIIWSNWMTYKTFLFVLVVIFSNPAMAQEKLILLCDVNFENMYIVNGREKIESGKDKIQIDITSIELPNGHEYEPFKSLLNIYIKGSTNLALHVLAPPEGNEPIPPEGKGPITSYLGEGTNRSSATVLFFTGSTLETDLLNTNKKKQRYFSLRIDRVTGLVEGTYVGGYPNLRNFTGTCKKFDAKKRAF